MPGVHDGSVKVYVEQGALRDELYVMERRGQISLVIFPYESKIGRVAGRAIPSAAQLRDLEHVTLGEMDFRIGDMSGSPLLGRILEIVGRRSRRDALHIDSAYKEGCKAFLSRDRGDIISNRAALEDLLGIRFFHPDDDWGSFLDFVGS